MGVQANLKYLRKNALFNPFSGFSGCSSHLPENGKKAKKADFSRFPGRAARHPLSSHLLHPYLRQPNQILKGGGNEMGVRFFSVTSK